jgi:hypothetical protein
MPVLLLVACLTEIAEHCQLQGPRFKSIRGP